MREEGFSSSSLRRDMTEEKDEKIVPNLWTLVEDNEINERPNELKYLSTMLVLGQNSKKWTYWLMVLVAVTISSLAIVFTIYWDIFKDWGLMNRNYNNYKEEYGMMSMKMMTMIMRRSGGGEEMMETGRSLGHLGRVVKDPNSGNDFDVSELREEENISPAKKKHYCRHTNSQIQANGSIWGKRIISRNGWFLFHVVITSKVVKDYK
ncbi:LOW QUALITY PROTEIN: hypothetical protein HID58_080495, partial [Brassica napus]